MQGYDSERHQYVAQRHERHNDLREMGDALDATEYDRGEYQDDDDSGRELCETDIAEAGLQHSVGAKGKLDGIADCVRLDGRQ